MRQATWIAFLLFSLGLMTYEASFDTMGNDPETSEQVPAEGGGENPHPKP